MRRPNPVHQTRWPRNLTSAQSVEYRRALEPRMPWRLRPNRTGFGSHRDYPTEVGRKPTPTRDMDSAGFVPTLLANLVNATAEGAATN